MLEQEVARLKGEPEPMAETELNLYLPAHIPASYIGDGRERLRFYKSLTSATGGPAREEVALDMRDRFGQFPPEVSNFLAILDFKQFLGEMQVEKADIQPGHIKLVWRQNQTAIAPERIIAAAGLHKQIKITPPATLAVALEEDIPFADALRKTREMLAELTAPASPRPA